MDLSCVCLCLSVCQSITTLALISLISMLKIRYMGIFPIGFSQFLTRGFLINEKANMEMIMCL